jgi:hypothetical protein
MSNGHTPGLALAQQQRRAQLARLIIATSPSSSSPLSRPRPRARCLPFPPLAPQPRARPCPCHCSNLLRCAQPRARRMTRWGKQQGGWHNVDKVSFAREVEVVPLQVGSSSSQSPAAVAWPQPRGTEDADEENPADTSSVIFTEVGDSRASSHAISYDEEDADGTPIAEPLMERQTSRVYRTDLTGQCSSCRDGQRRYGVNP